MYMHGHELHAMHFLLYAYLQTGQDEAAKQIVDKAAKVIWQARRRMATTRGMLEYYGFAAAHFPALYDLEMHHWAEAAALEPAANAPPHLQMITYWARTIGVARIWAMWTQPGGNARKFDEAEDATRKSKYAYILDGPKSSSRGEVHAWLAFAEKKNDDALRTDARGRRYAGSRWERRRSIFPRARCWPTCCSNSSSPRARWRNTRSR